MGLINNLYTVFIAEDEYNKINVHVPYQTIESMYTKWFIEANEDDITEFKALKKTHDQCSMRDEQSKRFIHVMLE